MKANRLIIKGSDLRTLPNLVEKGLKDAKYGVTLFLDSWNGIYVCSAQESYLRIWAYVITIIVMDLKEPGRCSAQIILAKGTPQYPFSGPGAEEKAAKKAYAILEKICKENKWEIEEKKELI